MDRNRPSSPIKRYIPIGARTNYSPTLLYRNNDNGESSPSPVFTDMTSPMTRSPYDATLFNVSPPRQVSPYMGSYSPHPGPPQIQYEQKSPVRHASPSSHIFLPHFSQQPSQASKAPSTVKAPPQRTALSKNLQGFARENYGKSTNRIVCNSALPAGAFHPNQMDSRMSPSFRSGADFTPQLSFQRASNPRHSPLRNMARTNKSRTGFKEEFVSPDSKFLLSTVGRISRKAFLWKLKFFRLCQLVPVRLPFQFVSAPMI
eukprot:GHVP01056710.1.p1 GENE.GHVP01056710.1~~GHVP01056710.1.p1  ORF type:complete len:259 (+),score=36.31 GHVP01056710.1:47-823(+)